MLFAGISIAVAVVLLLLRQFITSGRITYRKRRPVFLVRFDSNDRGPGPEYHTDEWPSEIKVQTESARHVEHYPYEGWAEGVTAPQPFRLKPENEEETVKGVEALLF